MDAKDLHKNASKSLLDKIASDPDIINRGAAEPAPEVVNAVIPEVHSESGAAADADSSGQPAPLLNLLKPSELPSPEAGGQPVAASAVDTKPKHGARQTVMFVVVGLVVLGAGGAAYMVYFRPASQPVAVQAKPSPTLVASPSATPTPTATPTPIPVPTPVQNTVTAPEAAPTPGHPQTVTVKSKSGLWLRSGPSSLNQKNVIGWIPYGGQVAVDAVGDFWWHGTYGGKTGYFAVNYTN